MKYISPLISDARNKLGGSVYARNRAGVYVRSLVAPTQPRTPRQQANRANFAALAATWKTLSQSIITGWNSLSTTTLWTDTMGKTYNPSGFQLWLSCARNLQTAGLSPQNNPPPSPPSFPTFDSASLFARTTGADAAQFLLDLPAALDPTLYGYIFKATASYSPGANFVGPAQLRNLGNIGDLIASFNDFTAQWNTIFANANLGQGVACELKLVEISSGYASIPLKLTTFWV